MSVYRPTPVVPNRSTATMQAYKPSRSATPTPPATPTPTPQIANVPAAPSLAQGSGSNLIATWTAPAVDSTHDAATGFNLQFSASGANTWANLGGVTSPYTLTGLADGAAYDVQVQSTNPAGTSAWSATATITTAAVGPYTPSAPSAPSLAQAIGSNLTVTWAAAAGTGTASAATSFNLQFSPSGAGTWTTIAGVTSPYILSGLAGDAAYDVQVQGANAAGTSEWSATSTLTTAAAAATVYAPNAAAAPSLAQGAGSALVVTWSAPATDATHGAAASYNLRSSPSGAGTWTAVSGVTSPYTLSGLTASAAYDVEVECANAAGTSAWSATATLTTGATGSGTLAPNTPVIASVAPPPTGTISQLTVTWAAPATDSTHGAATSYNLRSSPSGAGTWTTVTGVTSPYTLTGLTGATAIDVEVQAANAAASPSAWSAIMTGTSWGATVVPGAWNAATAQVHATAVAPNGGVNAFAVASPTAVTGLAFAWSASQSIIPTSGLIAAAADQYTNGWGAYFTAPGSAGTFYLWTLAEGAGNATIGALVSAAITVT